jgi:hypothetical protein
MMRRVPTWLGVLILFAITSVALWFAFIDPNGHKLFTKGVQGSTAVKLYEGLPHQMFEANLLAQERQTKPIREIHGYPFYEVPLEPSKQDVERLSALFGDSTNFKPFSGEKRCGGFHPDYAVEWQNGQDGYVALICFGCAEAKLFGPGVASRHDLTGRADEALKELLKSHRKNRPDGTLPK